MGKERIIPTKEMETLLIPLYCKASESKRKAPIIYDEKALDIVKNIQYDYRSLRIPKKTHVTLCMRAKQFDDYVRKFLKINPFMEEWYFSQSCDINKLDFLYRLLFSIMSLFPVARKAHRIFVFKLGSLAKS